MTADGEQVESQHSVALPFLAIAAMEHFLTRCTDKSETALLPRFCAWVRQQIANNWD